MNRGLDIIQKQGNLKLHIASRKLASVNYVVDVSVDVCW